MSHRSKEFISIYEHSEQQLRKIANIPNDYGVVLQGGASLQFSMVPLNLSLNGSTIDLINTGSWTKKALKEISKVSQVNVVASTEILIFYHYQI